MKIKINSYKSKLSNWYKISYLFIIGNNLLQSLDLNLLLIPDNNDYYNLINCLPTIAIVDIFYGLILGE